MTKGIKLPLGQYKCPKCGRYGEHQWKHEGGSLLSKTETEFDDGGEHGDPHYKWDETHECMGCGTIFTFQNGT